MVVSLHFRLGRQLPLSEHERPSCTRLYAVVSLPRGSADPSNPVSTPTPLNLSDKDIFTGPKISKDLKSATATNYEILLSELVFLQQQWVVPRKTAAGLAVLPLETSQSSSHILVKSF